MDWRALGAAVVRRRVELGFDHRKDFAKAKRLGERNLSDVEHGRRESYDPAYLVRLERALYWPPGTVDAILAGTQPPADLTPPDMLPGLTVESTPDELAQVFGLIRDVYNMLPFRDQKAALVRLRVLLADLDRWLAAALAGEPHGKTAAELLELAEDLDEDTLRFMLAALANYRQGRTPEAIVEARPRRPEGAPLRR